MPLRLVDIDPAADVVLTEPEEAAYEGYDRNAVEAGRIDLKRGCLVASVLPTPLYWP
ncbi:hypothetical protein GCM10010517_15910 [Streptosporangium fragile]|uniref:Uncharacterized protein n=1 Tax=Streptosporangium fragile TaxID=46186 RepID=A0ABN3VTP0_9ACTN